MTIGCTRCGATCDGDIIVPSLAFGFKHNSGCGHGVGPLAVMPPNFKAKSEKKSEAKEVKVETVVKENKPQKSKSHSFSKKE